MTKIQMFMNAGILESPERKLVMWYKCNEKMTLGLTKAQIARELGVTGIDKCSKTGNHGATIIVTAVHQNR